jgi:tetratricopeptide (TPR) repeat protein
MNFVLKSRILTRFLVITVLCVVLVQCNNKQEVLWEKIINNAIEHYEKGYYPEGEKLAEEALIFAERTFSPDHKNISTSLFLLSEFYVIQGKYIDADSICKRGLEIVERTSNKVGECVIFQTLAKINMNQGKLTESEEFSQRALTIAVEISGKDDKIVGFSLINLAQVYKKQEEYEKASTLYIKAIHILEEKLGSDHHRVALAMMELAQCYRKIGKEKEAKLLNEHALKIYFK